MTFDPTSAQADDAFDPTSAQADTGAPDTRTVLRSAVQVKPDDAAEVARLRAKYPQPADVLLRNLTDVRLQEAVLQADERLKTSPKLAERMRNNPWLAKQAHDDIPALTQVAQFVGDLGRAAEAGVYSAGRGAAGTFRAAVELVAPYADALEVDPTDPTLKDDWRRTIGGNPLRRLAEGFGISAELNEQDAAAVRPKGNNWLTSGIFSGIESLSQNLLTLPVAMVNPAAGLASMGAFTGGSAYEDARAKGLPMEQALPFAASQAAIEIATEKLPLGKLLEDVKAGTPFFQTLVRQIGAEIPGEQLATVLQDLNEWAVLHPEKPFSDYLAERPSAFAQTLVATIVGAGGNVAIAKTIETAAARVLRDGGQMQQAGAFSQALEQALKAAESSALRERNPDEFRQLMADLSDNGTVYVDAEVLNQMPADVLQKMEGVAGELPAALAAGDTVAVRLADAMTLLAGTPQADLFMQHARIRPDAPSAFEAEEAGKSAGEFLKQEAERVLAQAQDQEAARADSDAVRQGLLDQLNTAARFSPAVNEGLATWAGAFYTTMAARSGMTAQEFFQRFPLRVLREATPAEGPVIDQSRPGRLDNIEAYHYSKSARPVISTHAFGTGLAGDKRDAYLSATDKRRRQRAYFYVDKGTGINPEAGVGGVGHRVNLSNIYDANSDPLRLRGAGGQDAFETRVLDAGFAGYLDRLDGGQSGQVILLGDQTVKPEVLGPLTKTRGRVVPPPAARPAFGRDVIVDRLAARKDLPAGEPEMAMWERMLKALDPEAAVAMREAGVFDLPGKFYKDGLLRAFIERTPDPVYAQSLSSRLPRAKKAAEDPLDTTLVLTWDVALSDEKTLAKNVDAISGYPNVRKLKGKGAKDPVRNAEAFIDHVVNNLLWLHDHMPAEMRDRARLWYDGARKTVEVWADRYGISEMQGAAAIAVLSPQNGWFANVSQAERIADAVFGLRDFRWDDAMTAEAQRISGEVGLDDKMLAAQGKTLGELLATPDIAARWMRVYDQTHNSRAYRVLTPEGGAADYVKTGAGNDATMMWKSYSTIAKAISVLVDGRAENVHYAIGNEHKVRNFYNNIFDPTSALGYATIDTHAVAAALLRPLASSDTEVNHAFGGTGSASSAVTGLNGTYPIYIEAYRRAAEARGLQAREMQSITWEAVRGLFEAAKKSGLKSGANAIWERYKAGEIDQAQAQQEILALAGGITPPSWTDVPYNDTPSRTYEGPAQAAVDAGEGPGSMPGTKVMFEVAPDPNDAGLTEEWNALSPEERLAISQRVAAEVVPKVLAELGTDGDFVMQVGGYAGSTNPSMTLRVARPELAVTAAKLLGHALSQDSMMVVTEQRVVGTDPVSAITINLPEGWGFEQVSALYDRLWELEHGGEKLVGGHTTADGRMVVLNYSPLSTEDLAAMIDAHLGGQFQIETHEVYSAFPSKEDYGYAGDAQSAGDTASRQASAQRRPDRLRSEATWLLREALDARRADAAGAAGTLAQGGLTGRAQPAAVEFDDALLDLAIEDLKSLDAVARSNVQSDAHGVIPGKQRQFDVGLARGDYTEGDVQRAFAPTLDAIRSRFGDVVTLWRADALASEKTSNTLTVYMAGEDMARRFATNGREAKPYSISVDDILMVYAKPSGYYEVIVRRSALDNQTLAQGPVVDQTQTPEFKAWFGDSQAVIAVNADTGLPVVSSKEPKRVIPQVMYHTTRNTFDTFEIGRTTVNSGTFGDWETQRHAVFVTPEVEASQAYGTQGGTFARGANVMPLYIKAENPLDLTDGVGEADAAALEAAGMSARFIYNGLGNWAMFDDEEGRDVVATIKAAGYDSVIFNDENPNTGESFEAWAVFSPEQIKSAIGNDGSFDANDPSILSQGPRGTFNPRTLELVLNEGADLSTFFHETGHFFLEVMADLASQPGAPAQIADDMAKILAWFGVPDLATWNAMTLDQKRPHHERWAESIEQYVMEGKAPSIELQGPMRRFSAWLKSVYKSIKQFLAMRGMATGGATLGQAPAPEGVLTDENGKPMVLYHGTGADIQKFDPARAGENMGMQGEEGIFFTSQPQEAAFYARYSERNGGAPNVVPAYVKMSNPLTLEKYVDLFGYESPADAIDQGAGPADYFDDNRRSVLAEMRRGGHDGVRFDYQGQTLVIVFDPKQIVSSISGEVLGQDPSASAPGPQLNDDIRRVMDRMLATDEQIAQANEAAGMAPDEDADAEAAERLNKRSMADLKWAVAARDKVITKLRKQARAIEKDIRQQVEVEVDTTPEMRAKAALDALKVDPEHQGRLDAWKAERDAAEKAARTQLQGELLAANPEAKGLAKGQLLAKNKREIGNKVDATMIQWERANPRPARTFGGTEADVATIADSFGFESVDKMLEAIDAFGPRADAIDSITQRRMLEEHGDLVDEDAIRQAANEAVHNEARARSLATELRTQREMLNARQDTGEVNAKGSKITVNALVEAAKQFGAQVVGRTPLADLKNRGWQHTAAERRAAKRWADATAAGKTEEAVKAKQDQLLNNAAAKAALEARVEAKKILDFFKRVAKGNSEDVVEKGRDADVVNAARAVLAAYGFTTATTKTADTYLEAVAKHDPETFNVIKPMVEGALRNAMPIDSLTFDQLQALRDDIDALWHLAKRMRQMEVAGNLIDIEEAADEMHARMVEIGIPDTVPGEAGAVTKAEERARFLQFARALLRRVEQWTESMDGRWGGPFSRFVFQPIKQAADAYRTDAAAYRKRYQALVDSIAPSLRHGLIEAPELGYTFGRGHNGIGSAELLHAILHTGNESNKRKLLLGRQWAEENPDGTLDTRRWDAFITRMINEGRITKAHYDFAQGVWDLLEETKPLAQKAHRDVFGRYFDEVTADAFVTPFGTYRGGYVPAQADPMIVQDADLRALAEAENESMAYSFPTTSKGFTKSRVEYNRPLKLDLRTIPQHLDKVLLFSHMEPAVRGVSKLLRNRGVAQALGRIDPAAYSGMLLPWLNRSARQQVETPVMGDGRVSRVLSVMRSRAGAALMFANVSNALQQATGLANARVLVQGKHLRAGVAQMIAHPKKTREQVAAASQFMARRMDNEVAAMHDAMNEILLNPSLYERAQAWAMRNSYFLQTAMDGAISPMVWIGAYNQALAEGQSEEGAVAFADGVVRKTQGSTLPEDVSRIETGPAYARLFTQFIGYFNMMANTNGTALAQIAREVGLKKGAGKALGVVFFGMLAPIWAAEVVAQLFKGGPDDDDGDGYLDDWLAAVFGMGTIKGTLAQIPFVAQAGQLAINQFNANPADDRFSLSPAVSLLESAVRVPHDVYKTIVGEGNAQRLVRDSAALVSIATGLPAAAAARPLGYAAGVAEGRIDPTGPVDAARGLVTGVASPDSKQR